MRVSRFVVQAMKTPTTKTHPALFSNFPHQFIKIILSHNLQQHPMLRAGDASPKLVIAIHITLPFTRQIRGDMMDSIVVVRLNSPRIEELMFRSKHGKFEVERSLIQIVLFPGVGFINQVRRFRRILMEITSFGLCAADQARPMSLKTHEAIGAVPDKSVERNLC